MSRVYVLVSVRSSERSGALDTFVLDWTCSLQMRHFLTRGEQREQVAMCPQGPNRVSLFMSEHTMHSSSDSMLLFRDGLRVPTWPLGQGEHRQSERGGKSGGETGKDVRGGKKKKALQEASLEKKRDQ